MIHRTERDILAEAVRQFLELEIDELELWEIAEKYEDSEDSAVRQLSHLLDFSLDDDIGFQSEVGNRIAISKETWNYIQRYLLLLDSDRELKSTTEVKWSSLQLVALAGTIAFLFATTWVGWLNASLYFSLPLGLLSLWISKRKAVPLVPFQGVIEPFDSFSSLRTTYEETAFFEKMRFQKPPEKKASPSILDRLWQRIRFRVPRFVSVFNFWIFWGAIFPSYLFLPFQIGPTVFYRTHIVASEESLDGSLEPTRQN